MASIYDVAREAGVSIATVSRVLQDSPKVRPNTKAQVEEAIRRLDYHPNHLAQQFRSQKTGSIGVLLPDIGNTFYTEVLSGIESVARRNHYNILISFIHGDPEIEEHYYNILAQKRVDGIIAFSTALPEERLLEYAVENPVVIGLRYVESAQIPNVTIDNFKASADVTRYILNLGHRRLCCLAGPEGENLYQDRLRGFLSAVSERGLEVEPDMILRCEPGIQSAYDTMSNFLNAGESFTAVVASGDTMAIGAIRALRNAGLRVPEDVAVVGFDDIELSRLLSPTLTTIRQPQMQIGTRAMELLLDRIEGKPVRFSRHVLDYELVIRESSGGMRNEP